MTRKLLKRAFESWLESRILKMLIERPDAASDTFKLAKAEIISILQNELDERDDGFLENLKQEVDELKPLSTPDVAQHLSPTGQIMTSDTVVVGPETQIRRI